MADHATTWQSRPEAGSSGGLRILLWIAQHLGRGFLHSLLWPVSVYFVVVRGPERRASHEYLSRVFGRPASLFEVTTHFHRFATTTADRFYFLAGQSEQIPVEFVVDPKLSAVLEQGAPGIFLAAHFGSFEAARVVGPVLGGIRLRIVLDKSLNERFMEMMAEVEPELARLIIDSEQDAVALGLCIGDALRAGDWVGFLADRHRAGDRTRPQTFLDDVAEFPAGPYIIANLFKAPIIGAFCRLHDGGYEVHLEVIRARTEFARRQRESDLDAVIGDYVARLEHHVRASPYAWFNFFDFWSNGRDS
jgi:predicted LPLAT superfamily acyltransferase